MNPNDLWNRFKKYYFYDSSLDFALDISRVSFPDEFFPDFEPELQRAYAAMDELEAGAIANPDENRMVGHYWLRAPQLAPGDLGSHISQVVTDIEQFAGEVHAGTIRPQTAPAFKNLLLIGIGGSALGPQFVTQALNQPGQDKLQVFFFDNTDPDGLDRTLARIGEGLSATLTVVISKSGGTKETRNGMLEARAGYERAGLQFGLHAVAITEPGSQLDKVAEHENWLKRFPMFDWVGGRTSELSAVGLLPAALQGYDITSLLAGAAAMDVLTRNKRTAENPAALLAAVWFYATGGKGQKDMVILPYKDRLELFSRYLQQLVMESLGKKLDLNGNEVHQGIAVYGNKGSTDQHAYVQQLRDGVANFFVTFIEVLEPSATPPLEVEPGIATGDFLSAFLYGTRRALFEGGRDSITVTIPTVNEFTVGQLIALFERAVGFYGTLVHINAYHQPGVEAGKKAGQGIIEMQGHILEELKEGPGDAEGVATRIGSKEKAEDVFHILRHLAASNHLAEEGTGVDAVFSLK